MAGARSNKLLKVIELDEAGFATQLKKFDIEWTEKLLEEDYAKRLRDLADPARLQFLEDLVVLDLKNRWKRGLEPNILDYHARFPELSLINLLQLLKEKDLSSRFGRKTRESIELLERASEGELRLNTPALHADVPLAETSIPPQEKEIPTTVPPAPNVVPEGRGAPERPRDLDSPVPDDGESKAPTHQISGMASDASVSDSDVPIDLTKTLPPGVSPVLGHYRLIEQMDRGGMGVVWAADDLNLLRKVAVKIPFYDGSIQELKDRCRHEARAAGLLDHPNICAIHDSGEYNNLPYLVMPYYEGQSLYKRIRAEGWLPEVEAASLICKLAKAMAYAHQNGVIHRDLKSSNVLLKISGEPVILDFGCARRNDLSRITETNTVMGTVAYMSPEQIQGVADRVGPPSDIYNLGVILYETLTKKLPFMGNSLTIPSRILTEPPTPISTHRPDVHQVLQRICGKAMAKKVEDRFLSMHEFAKALETFVELVNARPPSPAPDTFWDRMSYFATLAWYLFISVALGAGLGLAGKYLAR